MLHASRIRAVASFLVVFLSFGVASAQAAYAADDQPTVGQTLNADQAKRLAGLPADKRNTIRDDMNKQLAKTACGNPVFFGCMVGADCEQVSSAAFGTFLTTPEQSMAFKPGTAGKQFCAGLAQVKAPMTAVAACSAGQTVQDALPVLGAATRVALQQSPGGQFVLGAVDTVAFIANAKDGFEKFSNTVKAEAVKSTNEVMNNLLKTSALNVDDEFRNTWAAFAAIGIVVLALMYFKLWKDVSDEVVDIEEAQKSLFWYGPLSIILVLVDHPGAVRTGDRVPAQLLDQRFDRGFYRLDRRAYRHVHGGHCPLRLVPVQRRVRAPGRGGGLRAAVPGRVGAAGDVLPPAVRLVHDRHRDRGDDRLHDPSRIPERVAKTGTLWLAIGLSKPVLVLLMGAVFTFISTRPAFQGGGTDDALVNAGSVFMAASAMLLLAFSPRLLFKYVPLLPSSSTSVGADRGSVAGAATVAGAGAGVAALIRNRRIGHNRSASETAAGSTRGSLTSTGPSRTPGQDTGPGDGGRNISQLQRNSRSEARPGTGGTGQALKSGAGAVARGSGKVAMGGATAFLLAGREAARQAAMRGRRSTASMAPDTDHISGR